MFSNSSMIACSYVSSVNKLGIFNLLYFSLYFYDKQEFSGLKVDVGDIKLARHQLWQKSISKYSKMFVLLAIGKNLIKN